MATADPGKPKKQYEYTELKSLLETKSSVRGINVIAVVKFFREPIKSRGTSYSMTIGLTDPSLQGRKFICTVFNDELSRLPQIKCNGDVVIFHRLVVEPFGSDVRGCGYPGMGFASAVFDGQSVDASLDFRTGWSSINVTDQDKECVGKLRRWYHSSECPVEKESSSSSMSHITTGVNLASFSTALTVMPDDESSGKIQVSSSALRHLEELNTPNTFFDIVAYVLEIYRAKDDSSCIILRIWDGTSIQVPTCPTQEDKIIPISVLNNSHTLWLARHRFMDIYVFDEHANEESLSRISVGCMVLIVNVHLVLSRSVVSGGRRHCELRLHGGGIERFGRGIYRLDVSAGDEYVVAINQSIDRLQKGYQPTRLPTRYDRASEFSLSQMLSIDPVTWKYKVTARVKSIEPESNQVLECLHWICMSCQTLSRYDIENISAEPSGNIVVPEEGAVCSQCDGVLSLEMIFQILFEDADGSLLLAHLWGKNALTFFSQYLTSPKDLLASVEVRQNVAACLRYLPGNEISFILVSYLPENADPNERQYQILDTEIVV